MTTNGSSTPPTSLESPSLGSTFRPHFQERLPSDLEHIDLRLLMMSDGATTPSDM